MAEAASKMSAEAERIEKDKAAAEAFAAAKANSAKDASDDDGFTRVMSKRRRKKRPGELPQGVEVTAMSDGEPLSADSSESEAPSELQASDDPMGADALLTKVCGLPEARALGEFLTAAGDEARRDIASLWVTLQAGRAGRTDAWRGGKKASAAIVVGTGGAGATKRSPS